MDIETQTQCRHANASRPLRTCKTHLTFCTSALCLISWTWMNISGCIQDERPNYTRSMRYLCNSRSVLLRNNKLCLASSVWHPWSFDQVCRTSSSTQLCLRYCLTPGPLQLVVQDPLVFSDPHVQARVGSQRSVAMYQVLSFAVLLGASASMVAGQYSPSSPAATTSVTSSPSAQQGWQQVFSGERSCVECELCVCTSLVQRTRRPHTWRYLDGGCEARLTLRNAWAQASQA